MVVISQGSFSKPKGSLTEAEKDYQIKELIKCHKSFRFFLTRYVRIQDRAKERTVSFELWPHLEKIIVLLLSEKMIIIGKARQLGITTLMACYALWKALFSENVKVLVLSQGEDEAKDFINKVSFIHGHLPGWMRSSLYPDSTECLGFTDVYGEIKAYPSTEKAGRSTDASLVICDEWERHPFAEDNFASLKPTVSAGGQFVGLSTSDTTKLNTFFKKKYIEAISGMSEFRAIFLGALERPGRDMEWYYKETRDLREHQKQGEYPLTENDMLTVVKTRKYFNPDSLAQMPKIEPVVCDLSEKWHGMVKIYKLPQIGKRYVVFTDPSDGKEDPHAIIVRDHITGEWVAVSHGMTPADECARIHDDLVRFYNNAFNSFELNSRAGGIFSEKISGLGTPSICPFVDANGKLNEDGKVGWWTHKQSKEKMRLALEENIRLRLEIIYDKEAIDELGQYIQPEGEDPQAPQGGHDDFVIAGGGVLMIDKYVITQTEVVATFRLRERW